MAQLICRCVGRCFLTKQQRNASCKRWVRSSQNNSYYCLLLIYKLCLIDQINDQVAFNEALVAAQSSAAGSTELAACAAECAAHCMTLMKGGEAVNPDTQTAAVCPGGLR